MEIIVKITEKIVVIQKLLEKTMEQVELSNSQHQLENIKILVKN